MAPKAASKKKGADSINQKLQMVMKSGACEEEEEAEEAEHLQRRAAPSPPLLPR